MKLQRIISTPILSKRQHILKTLDRSTAPTCHNLATTCPTNIADMTAGIQKITGKVFDVSNVMFIDADITFAASYQSGKYFLKCIE